jgi:hypothetical protein
MNIYKNKIKAINTIMVNGSLWTKKIKRRDEKVNSKYD